MQCHVNRLSDGIESNSKYICKSIIAAPTEKSDTPFNFNGASFMFVLNDMITSNVCVLTGDQFFVQFFIYYELHGPPFVNLTPIISGYQWTLLN